MPIQASFIHVEHGHIRGLVVRMDRDTMNVGVIDCQFTPETAVKTQEVSERFGVPVTGDNASFDTVLVSAL